MQLFTKNSPIGKLTILLKTVNMPNYISILSCFHNAPVSIDLLIDIFTTFSIFATDRDNTDRKSSDGTVSNTAISKLNIRGTALDTYVYSVFS